MKRLFVFAGLLSLLVLPYQFQAADVSNTLKIAPMDRDLDDVGCVFRGKKDKPTINPLFISDPQGIWMNINDSIVKLTDLSEADNEKYQEYQSGDINIKIYTGKYKQHEGGVSYSNAKMTVTNGKQTQTIKLKGGCAC